MLSSIMVLLILSTVIEAVQDLAVSWTWSLKFCKLLRKNRMLSEIDQVTNASILKERFISQLDKEYNFEENKIKYVFI
jgi:hypothetical protein